DPPSTETRAGPSARTSVTSDAPSSPAVTAAAGPDPLGAPGGSGGTATSTVAGPTGTRATTVSAAPSDPSAGSCASPAPDGSPAPEVRPASDASPDRVVAGAAGVAGEASSPGVHATRASGSRTPTTSRRRAVAADRRRAVAADRRRGARPASAAAPVCMDPSCVSGPPDRAARAILVTIGARKWSGPRSGCFNGQLSAAVEPHPPFLATARPSHP